jgi:hypothetical protein
LAKFLNVAYNSAMGMMNRMVAGRNSDGMSDRRWVILGADGRYVTLGRATDPTESEIQSAEEALRIQGSSGWLAIMNGSPHARPAPDLVMVRTLAEPQGTFDEAVAAFHRSQ